MKGASLALGFLPQLLASAFNMPSAIVLIAVNLVPLAGALFLDWPPLSILALYWAESAIIGLWNIPRILFSTGGGQGSGGLGGRLFLSLFFTFHYGIFMAGHLVFLSFFFAIQMGAQGGLSVDGISQLVLGSSGRVLTLVGLFLSHGFSFWLHGIKGGELKSLSPHHAMHRVYGRILLMHLALLLGGFFVVGLGLPAAVLAVFVLVKIIVDLRAHLKEHGRMNPVVEVDSLPPNDNNNRAQESSP